MSGSKGYSFPLMLAIIASLTFAAGRIEISSSYRLKRDREEELLFRGRAYMRAIQRFYASEPSPQLRRFPRTLNELIADPRFSNRRYIRELYKDPMTNGDFRLLLNAERMIIGVASSSNDAPFKTTDFEKEFASFEQAKSYSEWQFNADLGTSVERSPVLAQTAPKPLSYGVSAIEPP